MASLPKELQPEIQRMMVVLRKELPTTTISEIYQLALAALDKLCEQQYMFKQLTKNSYKLKGACNKSYLKIKCRDQESCDCKPKKKSHFRRTNRFQRSYFPRKAKGRGHFAKACPKKKNKREIKMLQSLQDAVDLQEDEDLESILEEQSERDRDTQYVLYISNSEEEWS
ncbi:hypothetical protein PIB30_049746 [Stylosanthes scabra]|uniref:Uncharacterized protein n=1 Tax=Stylosanthes scabra TaxID=79078 RepID=A0ABU6VJE3_9FABA|nr:hypothetical protein [Stylosanthes scabra]